MCSPCSSSAPAIDSSLVLLYTTVTLALRAACALRNWQLEDLYRYGFTFIRQASGRRETPAPDVDALELAINTVADNAFYSQAETVRSAGSTREAAGACRSKRRTPIVVRISVYGTHMAFGVAYSAVCGNVSVDYCLLLCPLVLWCTLPCAQFKRLGLLRASSSFAHVPAHVPVDTHHVGKTGPPRLPAHLPPVSHVHASTSSS